MIADLIIPIDSLRGMLRKDGYYFRMYRGTQVVQRCPNRKGHVKTEGEKANQQRFAERYGSPSKKAHNDPKNVASLSDAEDEEKSACMPIVQPILLTH